MTIRTKLGIISDYLSRDLPKARDCLIGPHHDSDEVKRRILKSEKRKKMLKDRYRSA